FRSWDAIALEGEKSWYHEVFAAYPPSEWDTQGKRDKLALRQGLKFVAAHPGLTMKRDVVKFFDFWGLEREIIAGLGKGYFGSIPKWGLIPMTVLIFGSYALALILGLFGLVMAPPTDRRIHWFLFLLIAFFCGVHTLVFAHSRYHLPIMPFVLLYSASSIVAARE